MAIKPEEKQPQVETSPQIVTSPDGKVQIINHHPHFSYMGGYCVEGAVKYVSPEPNLSAEIKADYYTMDGEFIDTEVTTVEFLEPGRTTYFFIMYSGQRYYEVQHYKLYIMAKRES